MKIVLRLVISLALGLVACGDDSGGIDAASEDGGSDTQADSSSPRLDCAGMPDGAACGEELLCIGEVCLNTRCGDGYVDEAAGEDCDDENEISGDGCEPASCVYSCTPEEAESCDDGDPCNGPESCGVASHRCEPGTPLEETACERDGGLAGICSGGLCAPLGCGNGTREGDEICDDGNEDQNDGCKSDCTYTCVVDIDCSDANACNGTETCEVATHTCNNVEDIECDDEDDCTTDSCQPAVGCVFTFIDNDEDGYATPICTTAGLDGGDCNDSNDGIYPTAPELCDGVNNDCDDNIDEDIVEVQCRVDSDNDGYGDRDAFMSACVCPEGTIAPRPDGNEDCYDDNSNVYEGSMHTSNRAYCGGGGGAPCEGNLPFDYNCDGAETRGVTRLGAACLPVPPGVCTGGGWIGGPIPACGESGTLRLCIRNGSGCLLIDYAAELQSCN